jgi:hypothetical protein
MTVTRLTGGLTPADGADPRTFPAIWNATATDLEAGDYSRVPTGGSAGQVLVKDSGTDYDAVWSFGFGARVGGGSWHNFGSRSAVAGNQPTQNELRFSPVFLAKSVTLSGLGIRLGTSGTGSAGAVLRLGVYSADANGLPDSLLLDAGTVDATQPAGTVLTIVGLSLALDAGFYWFAGALQGSAATAPFVITNDNPYARTVNVTGLTADVPGTTVVDGVSGRRRQSVTGALPSPASSITLGSGAPQIFARFD